MSPNEFEWIHHYLKPLSASYAGALALEDDAACLSPPAGRELVISTDSAVAGVHFLTPTSPELIAQKSFRSAVSDLVAKGATPLFYLMNFYRSLEVDSNWMCAFTETLQELQNTYAMTLLGGNSTQTPGPLAIDFTVIGTVAPGQMRLRSGAQVGDLLYVTGTLGDSFLYLESLRKPTLRLPQDALNYFHDRHFKPTLRLDFMKACAPLWSASIDISDGLLADVSHLAKASNLSAQIMSHQIPLSLHTRSLLPRLNIDLIALATGGEDFEIAFTASPAHHKALETAAKDTKTPLSCIGVLKAKEDSSQEFLRFTHEGEILPIENKGYKHF